MGGSKAAITTSSILGISAYYHDSAAALLKDGELVAAAQQERFSRKKHDARFPGDANRYCLEVENLRVSELDRIVFYDRSLLKSEWLLETYMSYAPQGTRGENWSGFFCVGFPGRPLGFHAGAQEVLACSDNRRDGLARRSHRVRAGFVACTFRLHPVLKKYPQLAAGILSSLGFILATRSSRSRTPTRRLRCRRLS